MPRKKQKPLPPMKHFISVLTRNILFGILFVVIALVIGMIGYHYLESMPWLDAFANASMILSGMGQLDPLKTNPGKLFAAFYALFCGLAFVAIIAISFAPVIQRFLHKIHLEIYDNDDSE